tara:strand:- start:1865 stop:2308 length:444 start_codon:yes stop_codon:yes gene_type:complete
MEQHNRVVKMSAFDDAWNILKYGGPKGMDGLDDDGNYPQGKTVDMHEYPPGSGNFMTLQDIQRKINAPPRSRANVGGQPSTNALASILPITPNPNTNVDYPPIPNTITVDGKEMDRKEFYNQNRNNIMVNSETGVYDPNDPNSWHPM